MPIPSCLRDSLVPGAACCSGRARVIRSYCAGYCCGVVSKRIGRLLRVHVVLVAGALIVEPKMPLPASLNVRVCVPPFDAVYGGIAERIAPIDLAAMRFHRRDSYDIGCN